MIIQHCPAIVSIPLHVYKIIKPIGFILERGPINNTEGSALLCSSRVVPIVAAAVDDPPPRWGFHVTRCTRGAPPEARRRRGGRRESTSLGAKNVRRIRVRGGNVKWRALRLDSGNYSWGSEAVTRKTRLLEVVYNASNNELVRTQTLVKSAIVYVDATPFKHWYLQHYGVDIGRKKKVAAKKDSTEESADGTTEEAKKSDHVLRKLEKRQKDRKLEALLEDQFASGRLLACISSRPGQCGRADGYILEGKELEFYHKKVTQKKKGKATGGA